MNSFKDSIKSGMTEYLEELKSKLEGLTEAELYWQASLDSNPILWLVWHMARVEDVWINSDIAGGESVWESGDWAGRTTMSVTASGVDVANASLVAVKDAPFGVRCTA